MSNNADDDDYYIDIKPAMKYAERIVDLFKESENYRELENGSLQIILFAEEGKIFLIKKDYSLKPLDITYEPNLFLSLELLFNMYSWYSASVDMEGTMLFITMACGEEPPEELVNYYDDDEEEVEAEKEAAECLGMGM